MQNSDIRINRRSNVMLREMRRSWRAVERRSKCERPSGGSETAV